MADPQVRSAKHDQQSAESEPSGTFNLEAFLLDRASESEDRQGQDNVNTHEQMRHSREYIHEQTKLWPFPMNSKDMKTLYAWNEFYSGFIAYDGAEQEPVREDVGFDTLPPSIALSTEGDQHFFLTIATMNATAKHDEDHREWQFKRVSAAAAIKALFEVIPPRFHERVKRLAFAQTPKALFDAVKLVKAE